MIHAEKIVFGYNGRVGADLFDKTTMIGVEKGLPLGLIDFSSIATVIHCAIDWNERGRGHVNQFLDVLDAAHSVERIIYFSSVWADPHAYGLFNEPFHEYTAGKLACEAFLRAWQEAAPGRHAVALRIGAYNPEFPETDAPWRLSKEGLLWHVQRAEKLSGFHAYAAWGDGDKNNPDLRMP